MSGIAGLFNLDGAPVDSSLLQLFCERLTFRGPDARHVWFSNHIGLCHTLLETTRGLFHDAQPLSLDGKVWISADARIDGRNEIARKLKAVGQALTDHTTDAALILCAYQAWDSDCVEHLIGDFAFAIWDGPKRRLFCARDHFGVKPFYYAQSGDAFIFSNTLDCVKLHPALSSELNDEAIADYLLFGFNQNANTTAFAGIRRLPPAHRLTVSADGLRLERYWTPPVDGKIRYKRRNDYVEHFRQLMLEAVEDRLRTDRAAVFMSGGLDSTSVAAMAKEASAQSSKGISLRALSIFYERLIQEDERRYAGLAAKALDIPIDYLPADDFKLYDEWGQPRINFPEPDNIPLAIIGVELMSMASRHCRVVLTGQGGDPAFYVPQAFWSRTTGIDYLRFLLNGLRYAFTRRRAAHLGLRSKIKSKLGLLRPVSLPYPDWLNRDFANRLRLPDRFKQINERGPSIHPTRPEAYRMYVSAYLPYMFESYDAGHTLLPVEVRHPFFDLRLVNFFLAIPPLPWCADKELLRESMRGLLPEPVRLRPKAILPDDPVRVRLEQLGSLSLRLQQCPAELERYVSVEMVPVYLDEILDCDTLWMNLRPLSLSYWLQKTKVSSYNPAVNRKV